jgi:hypothetical protein
MIGYFCGVTFDNDESARGISSFLNLFFMLVSGGLNNAATYPPVISQLQYISPNRYALESYFRVIINKLPGLTESDSEAILGQLGFTFGLLTCHMSLLGIFFGFIALGWFSIWIKN